MNPSDVEEHRHSGRREGDRIPEARLCITQSGEIREVDSGALFAGKSVVAFALPGAFTPVCSGQQLPRYEELAPTFREYGIDRVMCLSVNDPYVMAAWAADQQTREVMLVADGAGAFARAMGMLSSARRMVLGERSRRYSMLVRDGRIEKMFVEREAPDDPFEVSDADTMLRHVAPDAPPPPRIAIVTKPGCPHSARAKRLLDAHHLRYCELSLPDLTRTRALAAIVGQTSAPQTFIDGRHIGGADALERHLGGYAGTS